MIALALPDRPRVRELLAAGRIRLDYLETTGPWIESALSFAPRPPLLVHNSLWDWSLAHPEALTQRDARDHTLRVLEQTQAPFFSLHLGFSAADVVCRESMLPRSEPLPRDVLFQTICRNLRDLAAALPVPTIIENLDYNPGGAYEYVCEPDFISDVLADTGVGLLLDLAHAQVSASRLGLTIDAYLARLPLERVRQIHLNGPRLLDGQLYDAHETLTEADYALLAAVLQVTQPWAITLEYDRDEHAIIEQLRRLRALVAAV